MPMTQSDLDNINAAIASGELSVEVSGCKVTYRSIDDLLRARGVVEAELAKAAGGTGAGGVRRGNFRVTFATHRGD